MVDVLIIGAGPAGLSAGMQLARSNRSVIVFDRGKQRTLYVHNYHNFFGFPSGISGKELLALGWEQAESFGVKIIAQEVTEVKRNAEGYFEVQAGTETYTGRRIIFATGVSDHMPKIPEAMSFMGTSIFHCLDCDGYELIDKRVVVFGSSNAAADAALRVLTFSQAVFIAAHGEKSQIDEKYMAKLQENKIEVVTVPIVKLTGKQGMLDGVEFTDGTSRRVDYGYSTAGSKPHNQLAVSLGVETIPNGHIVVDRDMKTNIEHVYAVGDIINNSQQLSLAVAEGIRAAIMLNKTLYQPNQLVNKS